ncbi:MAG: S1C family serine protease [Acidimicrobiia bacterium]
MSSQFPPPPPSGPPGGGVPTPPYVAPTPQPPSSGGSGKRSGLIAGGIVVAGLLIGGGIFAASSGGDDDDSSTESTDASVVADVSTTAEGVTTTLAATGGLDGVKASTIQIVAQGTFRDPEVGFSNGSGAGSGFIISADGLAVTNNHVVAGAATLEVHIGGDLTKSYNASIVGVSECNDLALIDIDAPGELPFLNWYNGPIEPGLDVYAAGFPLGDPEYTLTRGIVAKAKAGGDLTGTSSIDHTIEHDANIQPGNSGGPLVTADGEVVAVNYAGGAMASSTEQFFAIASDLAQPAVDHLREGDYETLGINGWAVYDEAAGISGVWVAGVSPGSPASQADVLPGDIITSMNGLPIGTDGTFKDYCDVIRTVGERPIAVEALRYDTQEFLRGEINGTQPLEVAFSFAEQVSEEVSTEDTGTATYSAYETVSDDLGRIVMDVPIEWAERDTTPGTFEDGTQFPYIAAAPSLDGLLNTYDGSGVIFALLQPSADLAADLAMYSPPAGECTDLGTSDYSDAVFTGIYQVWDACAGTATSLVVLVAQPADASYTALILLQATTEADFEALDRIFATFNVVA